MASFKPPDRPVPLLLALADAAGSTRVAAVLRNRGFAVVEAHDGAAAMAQVRRDRPAAALVDLHLDGEVDGFELAHWLRRDRSQVRLVLASRRPHWFASSSDLGGVPVVLLPFDVERLVALLRGERDPGATPGFRGNDDVLRTIPH